MIMDDLTNLFKSNNTDSAIIITNKESIASFFEGMETCGVVVDNMCDANARSVYRNGVTIHFLDSKNIKDIYYEI